MTFWNVAGLRNKDRDFWKELKKWDVIVLSEMGGWMRKDGKG